MQFFTEEEVNAALEAVRPLAERLVAARRRLAHVSERLERVRGHVAGNGGGLDPERVRGLHEQAAEAAGDIAAVISELELLGVQIKDLDRGLMDFPTNDETVLLCWELGEEQIGYWHGVEEGFAGRKPLPF